MDEVIGQIKRREITSADTLLHIGMAQYEDALGARTVLDCFVTADKLALTDSLQSLWECYTMLLELVLRAQEKG